MKNLLHKKLNKKGFTLAELLVVIAIIAVLVAIALPIFTGSLNNARKATCEANLRSLRAAATVSILEDGIAGDATYGWTATANIEKNGTIGTITIAPATSSSKEIAAGVDVSDTATYSKTDGQYVAIIKETKSTTTP